MAYYSAGDVRQVGPQERRPRARSSVATDHHATASAAAAPRMSATIRKAYIPSVFSALKVSRLTLMGPKRNHRAYQKHSLNFI
ncbi:Protein of unknown function [Gryllus bimaculatus]|nr:Protein of unknown function [Gryllus bimaculatus]